MRGGEANFLEHMTLSLERIQSYTSSGEEEFRRSRLIQDAVLRNFVVLGELASSIPREFRDRHNRLPWDAIEAMRTRWIPHDLDLLWRTIAIEIPRLREEIGEIRRKQNL